MQEKPGCYNWSKMSQLVKVVPKCTKLLLFGHKVVVFWSQCYTIDHLLHLGFDYSFSHNILGHCYKMNSKRDTWVNLLLQPTQGLVMMCRSWRIHPKWTDHLSVQTELSHLLERVESLTDLLGASLSAIHWTWYTLTWTWFVIFLMNQFTELILSIQYSERNCFSYH